MTCTRVEWRLLFYTDFTGWMVHCVCATKAQCVEAAAVLRDFWADDFSLARLELVRVLTTEQTLHTEVV